MSAPLRPVALAAVPLLFVVTTGCLPPGLDQDLVPDEDQDLLNVLVCSQTYLDPLCEGRENGFDDEWEEIETFLNESPEVVSYLFVTQEDAYRQFLEISEDPPEGLRPDSFPPRYDVRVEDGNRRGAVASAMAEMCGVVEVHYVEAGEDTRTDFPGAGSGC
ncbi:permease-like cell division protein FtsX [Nocardiopsis sp. NPDC055551]